MSVELCRPDADSINGDCIVLGCGCLSEYAVLSSEKVLFGVSYALFLPQLSAFSVQ